MEQVAKKGMWSLLVALVGLSLSACGAAADGEEPDLGRAKGAFSSHVANGDSLGCSGGSPDGTCETSENLFNCAADCSCGDGTCDGLETAITCPVDCTFDNGGNPAAGDYCGNNRCDPWEVDDFGTILCTADCKLAPEPPGTTCGDYSCDPGETSTTCPADCGNKALCGNGACEPNAGEHPLSCPYDCSSVAEEARQFKGTSCAGNQLVAHYEDPYGTVTNHPVTDLAGACNNSYPWKLEVYNGTCNGSQLLRPDGTPCTISGAVCTTDIAGKFSIGAAVQMSQDPNKCGTYAMVNGQMYPVEWTKVSVQTCTPGSPCTAHTCSGASQTINNGPVVTWVPQLAPWSYYAPSCQ